MPTKPKETKKPYSTITLYLLSQTALKMCEIDGDHAPEWYLTDALEFLQSGQKLLREQDQD